MEIDWKAIDAEAAKALRTPGSPDRSLNLPLFENVSLTVRLDAVNESNDRATTIWTGHVQGTKFGTFVLAVSGDVVSGNVSTDSTSRYQIRTDAQGYWVHEIDATRFQAEQEPTRPVGFKGPAPSRAHRLAFLFSGKVRAESGGEKIVKNLIELTAAEINQGFLNSGLPHGVNVVFQEEVGNAEPLASSDLLEGFAQSNAQRIQAISAASGADMVVLLVKEAPFCAATKSSEAVSVSIVQLKCGTGNYSLAHELGHLLGLDDDRTPLYRPQFSFIHDPQPNPSTSFLRTVMGRHCEDAGVHCPRANYWPVRESLVNPVTPESPSDVPEAGIRPRTPADGCPVAPLTINAPVNGAWSTASCRSPRRTNSYASQYSFLAAAGDRVVINLTSTVDTHLYLLNSSDATLASNDDYGGTINARIPGDGTSFVIPSTGTYTIEATTSFADRVGSFVLTVLSNPPILTSPALNTKLTNSTATFSWTAGSATQYHLCVGTASGVCNIYDLNVGANLSATVAGLPTDSGLTHVKLWGLMDGVWQSTTYLYTSCCELPDLLSPAPGATLPGPAMTFAWSAGGATEFHLCLGRVAHACDVYNQNVGASLAVTVSNLPVDGAPIYAKLWGLIQGTWRSTLYDLVAFGRPAMVSPALSLSLLSSPALFSWAANNATQFHLYVGSTAPGSRNIFDLNVGSNLGANVSGIPICGVAPIYVRLWGLVSGVWRFTDYSYEQFCAPARLTSPFPGSTLLDSVVSFFWTPGAATQYHLKLGTSAGNWNIFDQNVGVNLSWAVTNLPVSGQAIVGELWGLVSGAWQKRDYTFTACNNCAVPRLTLPPLGATLADSAQTFSWAPGAASQYHLKLGTAIGNWNIFNQNVGTSQSWPVTNLPVSGQTIFAELWGLVSGVWHKRDYTFKACTNCTLPRFTAPSQSAVLADNSALFAWTAGAATQFHLKLGTAIGNWNIFNQNVGVNRSFPVTNLPAAGQTIFVELWGLVSGAWQKRDYAFTACTNCYPPSLITPTLGFALPSNAVSFSWTAGAATQYHLKLGTAVGNWNIFDLNVGTNRSFTVSNLPVNGQTIFVQLWGLVGGIWQKRDYAFMACTNCAP